MVKSGCKESLKVWLIGEKTPPRSYVFTLVPCSYDDIDRVITISVHQIGFVDEKYLHIQKDSDLDHQTSIKIIIIINITLIFQ